MWIKNGLRHLSVGTRVQNRIRFGSCEGRTAIGIRCTRLWNYVELFWNSLDNALSSIVFYLEMKVEGEVGVHDIMSRTTPWGLVSIGSLCGLVSLGITKSHLQLKLLLKSKGYSTSSNLLLDLISNSP